MYIKQWYYQLRLYFILKDKSLRENVDKRPCNFSYLQSASFMKKTDSFYYDLLLQSIYKNPKKADYFLTKLNKL